MSIAEAAGLILQSAASCQSGDAFVLDMGVPVRIELLARQMIELQGLQTGRDIQIVYTGLRPGEKLRETPIHPAERVVPGPHPKIRRILTNANSESKVETLETMRWKLHHMEAPAAIAWLRSLLGAYSQPGDSAVSMESTESA
jgi:FlaA1/EpsC-like NDP-sugar epimerase